MSFFRTQGLHFQIASRVIATIIVLSALYFLLDHHFDRKKLLTELRKSATQTSDVVLHSVLELAMMGEHPELLQPAVKRLQQGSPVAGIHIVDQSGLVRFSSDEPMIGNTLSQEDEGCLNCHTAGVSPQPTIFHQILGEEVLRHVAPIPNGEECHTCHEPDDPHLGVLIVDFPTSGLKSEFKASFEEMLLKAGLTVFAILVVLGLLMNKLVISRLKQLSEAVRQIGQRKEAPSLEALKSSDEIGQLAESFGKMAKDLQDYCQELEEKERARVLLLERLVHTQEDERKRISRELHDELGQSMSALLLKFQRACACDVNNRLEPRKALCAELEWDVRALIEKTHRLAWEMRPSILDDYGLDSALDRYIEETSKHIPVNIDYQHISAENGNRLPSWVEVTLYRVAQEALSNIFRHSQANSASVILMEQQDQVTLLIEDDGCGFEVSTVEIRRNGGLGLKGMTERVALCEGGLSVESKPGNGTTIRVRIPLQEA